MLRAMYPKRRPSLPLALEVGGNVAGVNPLDIRNIFSFNRESKNISSTLEPSGRVWVTGKLGNSPTAGRLSASEYKMVRRVSFVQILYL
jgi:hypothetical protein